ncbi:hypothetical protein Kim5_CH00830 [Rhizobium sp. Kim5]|uniref:hypothetical protein n=1 Tax=Rhizobium sp. Kim5 TaxID=2020311 RepID=UPI0001903668|nr:hypothetical protein [Rhizobium sp. Kim5]ARQ56937.1 hypothetical protein Kim5_CH00830 [Rhizobium sp. Kim5]
MLPEGFDRDQFIAGLREKHARILPPDIVFSVENGWLPLIADSLRDIERVLEKHGWIGRAGVRQIKEKLGDLRIYVKPNFESYSFPKALQNDLAKVREAFGERSIVTCEICADPGSVGNFDGYYQCLCPRHASQRLKWIAGGRNGDPFHD